MSVVVSTECQSMLFRNHVLNYSNYFIAISQDCPGVIYFENY